MFNVHDLLSGYDLKNLTVGVLGGHSALDVSHGAKQWGFKTVCVARKGREQTYTKYFQSRGKDGDGGKGCIDGVIVVDQFADVLKKDVQEKLRNLNTIFVHNRYFWVYFDDFGKVENDFNVPIFGSRTLLKLEERDQPYNQYHLLKDAGIRTPKIFAKPEDIDRPVLVKASEAKRGYERAFFIVGMRDKGILFNRPALVCLAHSPLDVSLTVQAAAGVKAEMAQIDAERKAQKAVTL